MGGRRVFDEALEVCGCALGERGEVVAALQDGDEATLSKGFGELAGPSGEGEVIVGSEPDIGEGIIGVGIKACGKKDQLWFKPADGGEAFALKGVPVLFDGGTVGERAIDGVTPTGTGAGFVEFAGMGV